MRTAKSRLMVRATTTSFSVTRSLIYWKARDGNVPDSSLLL